MYLGRIVEYAGTRELFTRPRHPYTQALLSAIPMPQPQARRKRVILQGDVASAVDLPSGCRFRTRCRHARPRCSEEDPPLIAEAGHATACHFWREIAAPAWPRAGQRVDARLERLQRAFRNSGPVT